MPREHWVTKEQLDTPLCNVFEGTKATGTAREFVLVTEVLLNVEHAILDNMSYEKMNEYIDLLSLKLEELEEG